MQLGIFAKTFVRSSFTKVFDAVKSHGLDCLQFNFSCAGLPTLPQTIEPALTRSIRCELDGRSLFMAAVSGTCNLIHPDPIQRDESVRRLRVMLGSCRDLGTSLVALCTGTRDPSDMWRAHPQNASPEAWQDLAVSLESLLPIAEQERILLGIEPEPGNVINSAQTARRLLDQMKSPSLKIIFDAANLVAHHVLDQQSILSQACDLLGPDIVLAHAKDLASAPQPGTHSSTVAAGQGQLDYDHFLALLDHSKFNGPLILHGLAENEVRASVSFLRNKLICGRN